MGSAAGQCCRCAMIAWQPFFDPAPFSQALHYTLPSLIILDPLYVILCYAEARRSGRLLSHFHIFFVRWVIHLINLFALDGGTQWRLHHLD